MELKGTEILVFRNCKADFTSRNGFKYPETGEVEAKDWINDDKCGNGLHALPWGCGDTTYFYTIENAIWQVIKVDINKDNYVFGTGELINKCKFKSGIVVFSGRKEDAIALIQKYAPKNVPINFVTQTIWNEAIQKAGDFATQRAGNSATQTAEYFATQTAGCFVEQKAGDAATQTAGRTATQKAGDDTTQIAGDEASQEAGIAATQRAGRNSIQIAGRNSIQIAGDDSIQTAGSGTVQIGRWFDEKEDKFCVVTRIITGLEAYKPYKFSNGMWKEVKE